MYYIIDYNEPNPLADTAVYVAVEDVFFNFKFVSPDTLIDNEAYLIEPEVVGYNCCIIL
tara:strand:+ start:397 stop:573 length:177 start_codon:yes stop_codon:yes gene_type:complete